jgi:hypothetical protein
MNAIYGLYPDTSSARKAIAALSAESSRLRVKWSAIVLMSCEPLEEEGFGWEEQRTPMPWLAVFGAFVGGTCGYALASFTQRTYPLPTGGMPIVAMWPTGIVMYELTMLGAIFTTILTFLIGVGLPNFKKRLYDPEVTNGKILVGVTDPDGESREELEQQLLRAGAEQVKHYSSS